MAVPPSSLWPDRVGIGPADKPHHISTQCVTYSCSAEATEQTLLTYASLLILSELRTGSLEPTQPVLVTFTSSLRSSGEVCLWPLSLVPKCYVHSCRSVAALFI